ncbi:MAG: hypothetical protein HGB12_17925 [Bacteroidetes bacterium]|nr:hypothetical protein [Bacteroidota bacterium]
MIHSDWENNIQHQTKKQYLQLHSSYIVTQVKSGVMLIDQQLAHERILFEHFSELFEKRESQPLQQKLFPQVIEFSQTDAALMKEILGDIKIIGFDIDEFGAGSFVVNATPPDIKDGNLKQLLEGVLENYKQSKSVNMDRNTIIAKALAKNMSIKHGKQLHSEEMSSLVDSLFACKLPYSSTEGKPTISIITIEELEKRFK